MSTEHAHRPMLLFRHPDPAMRPGAAPGFSGRILPVFLPFAGCPHRCIYCAQHLQTGVSAATSLEAIYNQLARDLEISTQDNKQHHEKRALGIGFYGGTFTALPAPWPERFVTLAARYKARGVVRHIRCSTRPDAINPGQLAALREAGLDMVELGIQSFDDTALAAAQRGYGGETAARACAMVREAGLGLGIQLMPGMPGCTPAVFRFDVDQAVSLAPDAVRLYPCLVLDHTPLASTWRAGTFVPWTLPSTVEWLAHAVTRFWRADIPIIRTGLAPEPELLPHVLAGPWHPALGNMIRSRALRSHIGLHAAMLGRPVQGLRFPHAASGDIWGHRGSLKPSYARIGLDTKNTRPWGRAWFCLF